MSHQNDNSSATDRYCHGLRVPVHRHCPAVCSRSAGRAALPAPDCSRFRCSGRCHPAPHRLQPRPADRDRPETRRGHGQATRRSVLPSLRDRPSTLHQPPAHQDAEGYRHGSAAAECRAVRPTGDAAWWLRQENAGALRRSPPVPAVRCPVTRSAARRLCRSVPPAESAVHRDSGESGQRGVSPLWWFYRYPARLK